MLLPKTIKHGKSQFMRFENQIIFITGSGKRLGKEMALAFAKGGADIVVHCRSSREEAEEVRDEIKVMGRRALLVQGDQGVTADVERMIEEIEGTFGRLDTLINSAAGFPSVGFEKATEEDFFSIIRANLYGPFVVTQKALPLLRKSKLPRVINFLDWAVNRPYKYYSPYHVSKGGLWTLTLALAKELAPHVLVNGIAPGPVLEPPDYTGEMREKVLQGVPLKRWGTPKDVVKAAFYLQESDYVTGEILLVDGGKSVS